MIATLALLLAGAQAARGADGEASGFTVDSRVLAGNPHDALVDGDVLWLALDSGVAAVDVGDPASPLVAGQLALPSVARGLALSGRTLFVAAEESGLLVIDATNVQPWVSWVSG